MIAVFVIWILLFFFYCDFDIWHDEILAAYKMIYKINVICVGAVSHLIITMSQFKELAFCVENLGMNK